MKISLTKVVSILFILGVIYTVVSVLFFNQVLDAVSLVLGGIILIQYAINIFKNDSGENTIRFSISKK